MKSKNLQQRKNLFSGLGGPMKLVGLMAVLFCLFSIDAAAQQPNYTSCTPNDTNGITFSSQDTLKVIRVTAVPGDTMVWVPVYVSTDSIMSGFSILMAWDRNKIRPSSIIDTVGEPDIEYLRTQATGRFLRLNPQNLNDTLTNFFSQISLNPFDSNYAIVGFNLGQPQPPDTALVPCPPGSGVIFRIAFRLFGTVADGDSALIRFYRIQPAFQLPPPGGVIYLDCRLSEFSSDWNNSGAPVVLYPTPINGYIVADLTPGAQISEFSAQPPSITQGSGSALRFIVSNTDSVVITSPTGVVFRSSTVFDGQQIVTPTTTTTYTITAYSFNGNSTATATVTVSGVGPNPTAPSISFPDGNAFTIEQGQTVSFRVRATDPDVGNTVTLRAISLPNNATFAQVVGTTTVEGTCSFTPDFNQEGSFSISFTATDNTNASNTSSATITVTALQFDRLFSTSDSGQAPVGGLRGKKNIVFPINMVTQQTVYGVQFDMGYDANALKIDSLIVTPRNPDYVVYDDIGGSPGQVRVTTFGLANDSIITDTTSTAILNSYWSLDSQAVPWTDYLIDLSNGRESVDPNPAVPGLDMLTDDGIIQCDNPGDVNLDKHIDVADLVNIVAYIIGNFGLPLRQFETADIIRNDSVNVFDLVGVINTIFGIPVSPVPPPPVQSEPAVLALAYNNLYAGQSDIMVVKSDLPVQIAAAELDITYDPTVLALGAPQLGADAGGMALQYKFDGKGNVKVILNFTNPFNTAQQLPIGTGIEMIKIPMLAARTVEAGNKNQVKLSKALLSAANSASLAVTGLDDEPLLPETFELFQNYPNPFNPTTTIMFTIGAADDGALTQHTELNIYNILGQRVKTLVNEELATGRYQKEWNATNQSGLRVATGVYFYRIVVGQNSQSKKMLLIK